jgi:hypothetical protein
MLIIWSVPPNLKFQICDLDESWNFNQKFTFIHARSMFASFMSPAKVIQEAFQALQPGGFLEIQDTWFWFRYSKGSIEGTEMDKWMQMVRQAAWNSGQDWCWSRNTKNYMETAGFVNIEEVEYAWATNTWPIDKREKQKGAWSLGNLLEGLESFSMAAMTRYLGKSKEEVLQIVECVKKEIANREIRAYIPV